MGSHSTVDNPPTHHKMVAAQVMKLLWAASLAVAAPQLDFGDQRSVQRVTTTSVSSNNINQDQVVSEVVGVLQPQIAKAVTDALASLRTTSISSSKASSSTGFAGGRSGNSGNDVNARAEYNFEYKVADEAEQTYISQQEQRDGDNLTGSYSYVDPNGSLVTVTYEAGAMGFSATSEKQDGFVSINSRKNKKSTSSAGPVRTRTSSSSSSSSSSLDQNALIAQIIATLQPQINSAVQSALATSSTVSRTAVLSESPRVSSSSSRSSSSSGSVEGTFGNGISVSIDTPEYNIAY